MRVLVFGGRGFEDREWMWAVLDRLRATRGISCIIEGEAPGADTLARLWGEARGVPVERYPITPEEREQAPRWAGTLRNQRMLLQGNPDFCLGFPGGPGSLDMARRARRAGVHVELALRDEPLLL